MNMSFCFFSLLFALALVSAANLQPSNDQNEAGLLIQAAGRGDLDAVRNLVEHGSEVSRFPVNVQDGLPLLVAACGGGPFSSATEKSRYLDVVRYLIEEAPEESRVPADIRNGDALFCAVDNNQSEIVRYLLQLNVFDDDQLIIAQQSAKDRQIEDLIEEYRSGLIFTPK